MTRRRAPRRPSWKRTSAWLTDGRCAPASADARDARARPGARRFPVDPALDLGDALDPSGFRRALSLGGALGPCGADLPWRCARCRRGPCRRSRRGVTVASASASASATPAVADHRAQLEAELLGDLAPAHAVGTHLQHATRVPWSTVPSALVTSARAGQRFLEVAASPSSTSFWRGQRVVDFAPAHRAVGIPMTTSPVDVVVVVVPSALVVVVVVVWWW